MVTVGHSCAIRATNQMQLTPGSRIQYCSLCPPYKQVVRAVITPDARWQAYITP